MNVLDGIPNDWLELINDKWSQADRDVLKDNFNAIQARNNFTPPFHQLFRALELTPLKKVKVLILGQDPYPTKGHAHGLAFSTEDFVQPFPRSLRNIFVELQRSIADYSVPLTGNLSHWAEQGVLLLNTSLSTEIGEANAHKGIGWESFTRAIIESLGEKKKDLVGLFWGQPAQKYATSWEGQHCVLKSSHPSPLSVRKGFAGCDHFNRANQHLISIGKNPIIW